MGNNKNSTIKRINLVVKKSLIYLKQEGFIHLLKKIKKTLYIRSQIRKGLLKPLNYSDVLFINGCTLPHPSRYRVAHQIEQLSANNLTSEEIFYTEINLDLIKRYRCFVFFRCPITDTIKEFIKIAHDENKKVFFDIDDLVIDKKYTSQIKYLDSLSQDELRLYDDGVDRMQQTLKMCDYAITTTPRLAQELKNYVPEVFLNRNVASEKMVKLSIAAQKSVVKDGNKVIMGYFSGSITHNDDFNMILPAIVKLMAEHKNLYLKIVGILDIPKEMEPFKDRIIVAKFTDWKRLPNIICSVDINLAPIENSIFNEAKSENKWVEAALCKVVTAASKFGAFSEMIEDDVTGVLCNDNEWYQKLNKLICDKEYRAALAVNAYNQVIKKNVTTYTGKALADFIISKLNPNICFVLPSTSISGGVNVTIKHCHILKNHGYDVLIINEDGSAKDIINNDGLISVISAVTTEVQAKINTCVATLWATLKFIEKHNNIANKCYLVQNFETDFYEFGSDFRLQANSTYCANSNIKYLTISKWCEKWLLEDYNKHSLYAPNGINLAQFPYKARNFNGKIKILVEGNSIDYYKNVDESFRIVEKLDKNKFEIYYLSYAGEPKSWYYVDKFMHKVPFDKVGEIYQQCDILIKSSILESFSYPPLEMMATGGICVVVPNEGNIEYLTDNYNCRFYEQGNIDQAVEIINLICNDSQLREKLIENGLSTCKERAWDKIETQILNLYKENI